MSRLSSLYGTRALAAALTVAAVSVPLLVPAQAADHVVDIAGPAFRPAHITVQAGDTVTWINRDIVPHTATADGGHWDTGKIAAGARVTVTVTDDMAGGYICAYHPSMTGGVTVVAAENAVRD